MTTNIKSKSLTLAAVMVAGFMVSAFQDVSIDEPDIFALRTGEADFEYYCASCHGVDAKGNGPISRALVMKPSDLTRIAARNEGTFPDERVLGIIDGRADILAHGPREMPVWGYEFDWDPLRMPVNPDAKTRIHHLVDYLKTIQVQD
ncbi:MAG: cytochrome c [Sphingomonadales bacterium]|nr:cytochrome c [Sphingomonadales bacterium]